MISKDKLQELASHAWQVRENASILGETKVGAALLTNTNKIYTGCNIEQTFRNKDIHAEVNAISNMISNGDAKFIAIVIVAEREHFTPCGCCMDWIFQFGGEETVVAFQNKVGVNFKEYTAKQLMPYYPR